MMSFVSCTAVFFCAAALCGCGSHASAPKSGAASATSSASTSPTDTSKPQVVATILAHSKAAMGGAAWDHTHSLRVKGTEAVGGLSGAFTTLLDLSTGRWIHHVKLGPIEAVAGFDGKVGWEKRGDGSASLQKAPSAIRHDISHAYIVQRGWWYPHRRPANIQLMGTKEHDGKHFQVLRITPHGGNPFEMWINAKTHHITRFDTSTLTGSATTVLSDYRSIDGLQIAFHKDTSLSNSSTHFITQLTSVSLNVPVGTDEFEMPTQYSNVFSIVGGGNKVVIPFTLTEHSMIRFTVKIDGRPFHFILDSGGANILSPKVATALGLHGKGRVKMRSGAGPESAAMAFATVDTLLIGGKVQAHDLLFRIFRPSEDPKKATNGRSALSSRIGPGIFKAFVVRIDYAHQKLTLIRHDAFDPSNAGTPVPIRLRALHPAAEGSINGVSSLFLIDTGAHGNLYLNAPFSRKYGLYARFDASPPTVVGHGYGGKVTARIAHSGKLTLGPVIINVPVMALSTATKGAFATRHIAGWVGEESLKHFTVTFDYADRVMYLKRASER